jgi:hypothetical protein
MINNPIPGKAHSSFRKILLGLFWGCRADFDVIHARFLSFLTSGAAKFTKVVG